jgi:hypothetical protein
MKKNRPFMFGIAAVAAIAFTVTASINKLRNVSDASSSVKETVVCIQNYTAHLMPEFSTTTEEDIAHINSTNQSSRTYRFVMPVELERIHSIVIPVTSIEGQDDVGEWVRFYVFKVGELQNPISNGVRYLGPLSGKEWKIEFTMPLLKELHGEYVEFYLETNFYGSPTPKREPDSILDTPKGHVCPQNAGSLHSNLKNINIKILGGTRQPLLLKLNSLI